MTYPGNPAAEGAAAVRLDEYKQRREAARTLGLASAAAATPAERRTRAKAAGKASAASMTPDQRQERASKAAAIRWAKAKPAQ